MTAASEDFHCKIGSTPAATNELERLVREWCAACAAVRAIDWKSISPSTSPKDMDRLKALYDDLSRTEVALRKHAKDNLP
jgi:hypothetical protein